MRATVPLFYGFHFYLFGLIAIASAALFVTRRSPVAAALWLVNCLFSIAALYVMMDAHFIGAIQVLVYAGAIMVVFLFVVMLLNLGEASAVGDARGRWPQVAGLLVGLALAAQVAALNRFRWAPAVPQALEAVRPTPEGAIAPIAGPLFKDQLLAFELTSVLLLAAIVGAVTLGRRKGA
jgi:NADH-quinone oxidoreductase subunit J